MAKADDTNTVPETLNAPWLKRFFKRKFGIPVRVTTGTSLHPYLCVWIQSQGRHELIYEHDFPAAFGNRCMRIVYPNSEKLREQNWGGNITSHSIAMHIPEWRVVLQQCIDDASRLRRYRETLETQLKGREARDG